MKLIKKYIPFVIVSLYIGLGIYNLLPPQTNWQRVDFSNEMVMRWDSRIQPLHEAIPADVKQVGYLEKSFIIGDFNNVDGEEYFLMQYSVAPIVLKPNSIEETWIIGNFDNDFDFIPWLDKNLGKYELQNFGFGLYLIQRMK